MALPPSADRLYYACDGPQPNEIIFTPAETDPPSAKLVRFNEVQTVMLAPAASGAKYEGDFGLIFWSKGDEAQVDWPQGTSYACKVKRIVPRHGDGPASTPIFRSLFERNGTVHLSPTRARTNRPCEARIGSVKGDCEVPEIARAVPPLRTRK